MNHKRDESQNGMSHKSDEPQKGMSHKRDEPQEGTSHKKGRATKRDEPQKGGMNHKKGMIPFNMACAGLIDDTDDFTGSVRAWSRTAHVDRAN